MTRRVTGITYNGKSIANYTYNPNGTLSQMQMGNGLTHEYTYDQSHINRKGLMTKIKSRNRSNTEVYFEQNMSYDTYGKLIQSESKDPIVNRRRANARPTVQSPIQHEVALIKKDYRYTQRDELLAIDLTVEKYTNAATNLNAVQSISTVKSQGGSPDRQARSNAYQYTYDETSNALTYTHASPKQIEQTTREIHPVKDELQRQTYSDGRQIQLSYDLEGNMTRKVRTYPNTPTYQRKTFKSINNRANSKTQTTDYSYDNWSRLKSVTTSGEGTKAIYAYNHKNERVLEVLPNQANHDRFGTGLRVTYWSSQGQAIGEGYITDPNNANAATNSGPQGNPTHTSQPKNTKAQNAQRKGSNLVGNQTDYTVRYIYSGNQKVAMIRPDKTGTEKIFYFINNAQGTPVMIMDEAGNIVSKIRMDDWGNVVDAQGQQSEINYTGKKLDAETGLYYFNQRYYDAELGRFITHDPAGQYSSPYVYCGNNPMQYIDPDGELAFMLAVLYGALTSAALSATMQYIQYGEVNWTAVGQSAIGGAISAGIFCGVGAAAYAAGIGSGTTAKIIMHAVAGGISSRLQGGDFFEGAIGAGVAQAFAPGIDGLGSPAARIAAASVLGGVSSWATGGDFVQGAQAAGFARAFNEELDHQQAKRTPKPPAGVNVPPGVNIEENIKLAKKNKWNLLWFKRQVQTGGPWDYKQLGPEYQDFGNWHYGVVGRASGYPSVLLKGGAGLYQIHRRTSDPSFWRSFFDDPRDTEQIQKGIDYYDSY